MDRIALDSLQMQLRNVPHLKKRDIYLFGVNNQARETIKILVKWGVKVCGILDNDFKKQGSYIRGIRVISVTSVRNITNRRKLFVIDSPLFASGEIRQIASVEKRQFGSAEIRQFESIEKSQS